MTDRKVVLTDSGNFPSDLYMAQGFVKHFGGDRVLRSWRRRPWRMR
jgi:kynureninase